MAPKPLRGKCYRRTPKRPAVSPGQPGSLRQQLAALAHFLDLQNQDRLTGDARERRWTVVHALHTDQPILFAQGGPT